MSSAVLSGTPSWTALSTVFVAASTWAFGVRMGWAVLVLELAIRFFLFNTGLLVTGVSPVTLLIPIAFTDSVVLLVLVALRRAEHRRFAAEVLLRAKNAELEVTLAEVKELRGMLPICAWCKGVRDVDGMWNKLEAYLAKHSHATFTHGICPACMARMAEESQAVPPSA